MEASFVFFCFFFPGQPPLRCEQHGANFFFFLPHTSFDYFIFIFLFFVWYEFSFTQSDRTKATYQRDRDFAELAFGDDIDAVGGLDPEVRFHRLSDPTHWYVVLCPFWFAAFFVFFWNLF